ncbi:helix-turn-helix domain-containing protein [Streptomyces sp. AV19]|uniref:DUF5753 domain-containing protein n=1 Tax=Streptomyces sp. AV19 TaxID=2793068 RepID=UPI0018FF06D5|nr:DUF5753 domain-containing protein [Streptomyces sp. AV19]MBH1937313.1 helix-turn-helix domain-containing protein [Streptomyces sp. AV19]MDG4536791.1 DUF5753 domain-containing protein [Streptomyces sp. AV19]
MGQVSDSPVGWRYCGNQIKRWRYFAGVSREELANEAGYTVETIKAMEQGRRRPTPRLLRIADEMCGAHGLLVAGLDYLQPEKIITHVRDYMEHEVEAIALCSYQPQLVPGLLQTEEYARQLSAAHWPPKSGEEIEAWLKEQEKRRVLLDDEQREFSFIIGEAVVRYPVGDKDAHRRQLLHLLKAGERRNVTIQVLRFGGAHSGLYGPFILLETPQRQRLVYEEGQVAGKLYADEEQVSILFRRHTMITRQALTPDDSARFIRSVVEEL